jgi:hypothetical protein
VTITEWNPATTHHRVTDAASAGSSITTQDIERSGAEIRQPWRHRSRLRVRLHQRLGQRQTNSRCYAKSSCTWPRHVSTWAKRSRLSLAVDAVER